MDFGMAHFAFPYHEAGNVPEYEVAIPQVAPTAKAIIDRQRLIETLEYIQTRLDQNQRVTVEVKPGDMTLSVADHGMRSSHKVGTDVQGRPLTSHLNVQFILDGLNHFVFRPTVELHFFPAQGKVYILCILAPDGLYLVHC